MFDSISIIFCLSLMFVTSSAESQTVNYSADAYNSYCAALYEGEYLAAKNSDLVYAKSMRLQSMKFLNLISDFKSSDVKKASEDALIVESSGVLIWPWLCSWRL